MPDEEPVSIVMPVHNAMPHLDTAVRCILDQSHRNFEFVIYDDGSDDGSTERLREWTARDERIRLIEGERNLGPVGSSNLVVQQAKWPLIARMDADDVCDGDRIRRQLEVLRDHPQAGLVASLFEVIDEAGRPLRGPEAWRLAHKTPFVPFAHGSILFRRSVFDRVGGYRERCEFWEDQDLIVRIAAVSEVLVIPRPLYKVRMWTKNTRAASDRARVENAVDLAYRSIARLEAGRDYDDLLEQPEEAQRIDPRVFIASGSLQLWAGGRPRLVSRLLKRARLGPDMRSLSAIVWTLWAAGNPSTLRAFLGLLLKLRNRRASSVHEGDEPLTWAPPGNPYRSKL